MMNVEKRLRKTDAGATTVATEDEIIASLEEMIDALKKARKENGQQPPRPAGGRAAASRRTSRSCRKSRS